LEIRKDRVETDKQIYRRSDRIVANKRRERGKEKRETDKQTDSPTDREEKEKREKEEGKEKRVRQTDGHKDKVVGDERRERGT
jgi:hypothetical protein